MFRNPDGEKEKSSLAARKAAAAQREKLKTTFFSFDPRVSARTAEREVSDNV